MCNTALNKQKMMIPQLDNKLVPGKAFGNHSISRPF